MPDKADVLLLQNGTYQCKTCVRSINAKADGEDHRISGNPYYNARCGEGPRSPQHRDKREEERQGCCIRFTTSLPQKRTEVVVRLIFLGELETRCKLASCEK
jgi:hypothetical protein